MMRAQCPLLSAHNNGIFFGLFSGASQSLCAHLKTAFSLKASFPFK